jgi:N-acetylglucosaminyl-diphospho-decaprenol L-rhamnosyltransferase
VSGALFLTRRQAWDELGGFDPGYFMYMEDVDLCWRAGRAGWGVGYEPSAEVGHEQGVSADQHPYRMIAAHHRSLWRFARRSAGDRRRLLLPVVAAGLVVRTVVAWALRWSGGRARSRPGLGADRRNEGAVR